MKLLSKIIKIKGLFRRRMRPSYSFYKGKSEGKNIIFILPANKHHAGGDKVIYRQSELINKLKLHGFSSQILHPQNPSFKLTWFDHQASFKTNLSFDPENDFVILPEIWTAPHAKMLGDIGIKYGIYIQNGYLINIPKLVGFDENEFTQAYMQASLILSISDDTTECIKLAFPNLSAEIIRTYCSIDAKKFKSSSNKENIITYMPRKLSNHSKMVLFFLQPHLPKHWSLEAIDDLDEEGVRGVLSRSKIFLSFSEFEGFGLPPVEAALSGNQVIGYTGEGAKEYWHLPIFTEVFCGDVRDYVKKILNKIQVLEQNPSIDFESMSKLANRYGLESEQLSISQFIDAVNKFLT